MVLKRGAMSHWTGAEREARARSCLMGLRTWADLAACFGVGQQCAGIALRVSLVTQVGQLVGNKDWSNLSQVTSNSKFTYSSHLAWAVLVRSAQQQRSTATTGCLTIDMGDAGELPIPHNWSRVHVSTVTPRQVITAERDAVSKVNVRDTIQEGREWLAQW